MHLSRICLLCLLWPALGGAQNQPLFQLLSPAETGVSFQNTIVENSEEDNVLAYEYYYNGGGVAAGDLNNDGLPELFFTANREPCRLYLNLGGLKFKDITKTANVGGRRKGWKTGVTFADVNADGWLDIYLCYSGRGDADSRRNQLWINNHDLTFTEQAHAYGLDDAGYGTQAAFFDFDRDGDLDCFLLNHNIKEYRNFENDAIRQTRDPLAGDQLLENRGGHFYDISAAAGIPGNPLGFGLGLAVSDLNGDGWPDLYVSNDYNEPDYLLLNDQKGHFYDAAPTMLGHMSQFSMGCDAADVNNDGRPDLLTLDMLPADNRRQKLLQGPENYEVYELMVKSGRHRQFMRNMLHLAPSWPPPIPPRGGVRPDSASPPNPAQGSPPPLGGAGGGQEAFSEIAQLAGLAHTDWSWSALCADFDNDGWKDVFITNGYWRDYTNRDFLRYWGDYLIKKAAAGETPSLLELVKKMPASRLTNFFFRNDGADSLGRPRLTFTDVTTAWGAPQPACSNGAAYADLDHDGDLEVIVNNLNEPAFIYRNNARETNGNAFLQLQFAGHDANPFGLGAQATVCFSDSSLAFFEQMPTRGYQSSVSEILHLGLGQKTVQSLTLVWPDGKVTSVQPQPTQRLVMEPPPAPSRGGEELRSSVVRTLEQGSPPPLGGVGGGSLFHHEEYDYNDFKRQPLLPHLLSRVGPVVARADVNGDGLDDLFIGASKWQLSRLFWQQPDGRFRAADSLLFRADQFMTVADAVFFDADGDRDLDLYLVAGGYEDYAEHDPALNDALYLNDGRGNFSKNEAALPDMTVAKSCARSHDFDGDGDLDLFVGGRVIPGQYPLAPRSFLLENDGQGRFRDVTAEQAPALLQPGLVTDAAWADLDGDQRPELLVCGEWMPIRVFKVTNGQFQEATDAFFAHRYAGLWNRLLATDLDGDGDTDLVAGNLGRNSQLQATPREPATLVYRDFDGNGSVDPILCFYVQGKSYPFLTRDELLEQIAGMRPRFTSYAQFADATLSDLFTADELREADTLTADHLATTLFENVGGRFQEKALPVEAQFAPVYVIAAGDFSGAGGRELLLAGNLDGARLRFGRYDANHGPVFRLEAGQWRYAGCPFGLSGDVRSFTALRLGGRPAFAVGINQADLRLIFPVKK